MVMMSLSSNNPPNPNFIPKQNGSKKVTQSHQMKMSFYSLKKI